MPLACFLTCFWAKQTHSPEPLQLALITTFQRIYCVGLYFTSFFLFSQYQPVILCHLFLFFISSRHFPVTRLYTDAKYEAVSARYPAVSACPSAVCTTDFRLLFDRFANTVSVVSRSALHCLPVTPMLKYFQQPNFQPSIPGGPVIYAPAERAHFVRKGFGMFSNGG